MKTAKNSLTLIEEKMAFFSQKCKQAGIRLTYQRIEIFREMAAIRDHPSAEMIYNLIRKRIPTISLDTIYRTLANFEAYGLISRVHTIESQAYYEVEDKQHHHLICERCGKIMDFEWKVLDEADVPDTVRKWGKVKSRKLTLQGICSKCIQSER